MGRLSSGGRTNLLRLRSRLAVCHQAGACGQRMKPTYTHNHTNGGVKTDGSCPRCNSYAQVLEEDMHPDHEIIFHINTRPIMQIMKEGEVECGE